MEDEIDEEAAGIVKVVLYSCTCRKRTEGQVMLQQGTLRLRRTISPSRSNVGGGDGEAGLGANGRVRGK